MDDAGQKVCFMAEYFLPDMEKIDRRSCGYEIQILEHVLRCSSHEIVL